MKIFFEEIKDKTVHFSQERPRSNLRGYSLSQSIIQLGTHAAVWSSDQRLEMAS
jgi:hypothetical protein